MEELERYRHEKKGERGNKKRKEQLITCQLNPKSTEAPITHISASVAAAGPYAEVAKKV
jgi:hypothetical protein